MAGAPSQLDLFDYKQRLPALFDSDLPPSIRKGQRLTTMTANQVRLPIAPSTLAFARHGRCGAYVSELLPHTAKIVDEVAFIKSMWAKAINHDPAITFCQTGNQIPGRPSIGSWISYGLGSVNRNLAGLRGAQLQAERAGAVFEVVGQRLSLVETCRCRLSRQRRSSPVPVESARRDAGAAAANAGTITTSCPRGSGSSARKWINRRRR